MHPPTDAVGSAEGADGFSGGGVDADGGPRDRGATAPLGRKGPRTCRRRSLPGGRGDGIGAPSGGGPPLQPRGDPSFGASASASASAAAEGYWPRPGAAEECMNRIETAPFRTPSRHRGVARTGPRGPALPRAPGPRRLHPRAPPAHHVHLRLPRPAIQLIIQPTSTGCLRPHPRVSRFPRPSQLRPLSSCSSLHSNPTTDVSKPIPRALSLSREDRQWGRGSGGGDVLHTESVSFRIELSFVSNKTACFMLTST